MSRSHSRAGRWPLSAAVTLACVLLQAVPGLAMAPQPPQSLEYAVKANYLVRFTAFVDWPPAALGAPSAPVDICVLGEVPFGDALERSAAGQAVNGRPLRVRRLDRIDAASGCHVAYIGRTPGVSTAETLRTLANAPVLTVTDARRGGERGVIHFAVSDNRVRFHVDEASASRSGLSISSRLLSLALSVRRRG